MSKSFRVDLSAKIYHQAEKYLKELVGRKDIKDALERLDNLTQEEARMAAIEALKITRGIDDKVEGVNERLQDVYVKVEQVDEKVEGVGSVIEGGLCLP